ncbi:MAG TPA: DUF1330 domain-containing protein [Vicinamibacterales bacterium]|jgi:uncharacterized protein (DUF1330 family)|nr:DUF1330 domain-containing protein [Vicinamibacterales bacterium]
MHSLSRLATALAFGVVLVVLLNVISVARQSSAPAKAYIVVQAEVTNPQRYAEYAKLSPGIIAKYGGKFLARGGKTVTLEGPPAKNRVVVIEFPSLEKAEEFYRSPEYTEAKKLREGAATAQFIAVEGF